MPADHSDREVLFVELYELNYALVLAYARRRTDESTAREVAAETFLVAWRRLDEVEERGLPWLYRTAALTLKNMQRSDRRQLRTAHRVLAEPSTVSSVVDPAEAHTQREVVRLALGTLSEQDRELLLLVSWEQVSTQDLAAAVGCSVGTTAVRLHRARRRLRRALQDLNSSDPQSADCSAGQLALEPPLVTHVRKVHP